MRILNKLILASLLLFPLSLWAQNARIIGKVIDSQTKIPLEDVFINLASLGEVFETDKNGVFKIANLSDHQYEILLFKEGYLQQTQVIDIKEDQILNITFELEQLNYDLDAVEITDKNQSQFSIRKLRNVEGTAIYCSKKSEVIDISQVITNPGTNSARQVFKGVAGLNIWESDGAGLQLSIGARGLDPNRTSNFNTRQNGYDISADALGYPESYYTPPTQALKRIEIVRGAASLQYGPQFGGLLNFVFKDGPKDKAFELTSENTVGSFGLFNSFNSIGGSKKGFNYYAFYQRKQGDGWRSNAAFHQNMAYAKLTKSIGKKLIVGFEYTYMDYLAQQAGGLQDFEFNQDPRQSKRSRNWFKVNWKLAAVNLDYKLSDKTKINSRTFVLDAQRDALGELGPINRPDPLRERDLIRGKYNNFGNETRMIHQYSFNQNISTLLIGTRYYQGYSTNEQGDASDGSDPDFIFLNPNDLEKSSYEFPSQNLSFFAENLFYLNDKWTITPGLRFEYISTNAEGFYKQRVMSGDEIIFEQTLESERNNRRSIFLMGLGIGYNINSTLESYANFSQNYRSINFTDLAVINPNLVIDSTLMDERGYNAEIGLRGNVLKGAITFDLSLFHLRYKNRIGITELVIPDPIVIEKAVAYRTNIGDAAIFGLETFAELDIMRLLKKEDSNLGAKVFTNFSLLHGEYLSGGNAIKGNQVELIPPVSLKTGLNVNWKNLRLAYQFSYVGAHYTDATNAEFVVDATRGRIPSYQVQDFSISYVYKRYRLQTGINNLSNESYFTRRAAAYPGPGIIPSDGRSFYISVGVKL